MIIANEVEIIANLLCLIAKYQIIIIYREISTNIQRRGSNPNTDKNRSFSISDGVKTASIHLQYDYSNMSALVVDIYRQLRNADLNIEAVQINDNHFELVASTRNIRLRLTGRTKLSFLSRK